MALITRNPIEIKIVFEVENNEVSIETSAHFEYTAEEYPGCSARKGIPITHTLQQETQIKTFAKNVWLPQIKASLE